MFPKRSRCLNLKMTFKARLRGLDQQQKEFFLNQQMKQIQEELGNPLKEEIEEKKKRPKTRSGLN